MTARFYAVAGALFLALTLPSCGGSSSTNPTTTTTTTLPACTQTTVFSGPGALPTSTLVHLTFTTSTSGRVDVIVDWTFASNPVALVWAQGDCIQNPNCNIIATNNGPDKPKTATAPNLVAGVYTLAVLNLGTTNESVSYQIFLVR